MPQKKNPDSLELLRGKSGRVFGNVCRPGRVNPERLIEALTLWPADVWFLDDVQGAAVNVQQGPARG